MKSISQRMITLTFVLLLLVLSCTKKDDGVRTIRLGTQKNTQSPEYKGLVVMQESLEHLSNGVITLELFPSSQLGDYKAMVGQVRSGELDMVTTGYPDMSFLVPAFEVIGEPYVITSYEHLLTVKDDAFAQSLHAKLEEQNIKFVDLWYTGARQTTSNRPLESIDDFKGLKLRTPNVPFLIHFAEAVGAIPSPIAFQEVYLALQTNQVETQENQLSTIESMKFFEVQKNIAMTSHFIATVGLWINKDLWDELEAEERAWLTQAVAAGRTENNAIANAEEKRLLEYFQAQGLSITYPDIAPIQEAMKAYYEKLNAKYAQQYGEKIIQKLQALH